jgi:hypothetical protein
MCNALRRDRLPDRRVVIRFDFFAHRPSTLLRTALSLPKGRSAARDLSTEARSAKVEGGTGRPPASAVRSRPGAASARSRLRSPVQSEASGGGRRERYWLLIELGDTEICKTYPGFDEDLYITAEAEAFVKWHAGQLTWAQATREGRIQLDGLPSLVRAFPTWNARSMFAHIRPVSRTTEEEGC